MSAPQLAPNVQRYLAAKLDSWERLELVVHLAGLPAPAPLASVCERIGLTLENAKPAADALVRAGLLVRDGRDGMQLSDTARQDPDFQATLVAYREDRIAILNALSAIAMGKIRSMAARAFADAFVLRKKKPEDHDG